MACILIKGPIYAQYSNELPVNDKNYKSHLVVVTGAVSAPGYPDLVKSNNPWGNVNVQTLDEFKRGIPTDTFGMRLDGVFR